MLLSETVADLYIIAGDLIDIPFYTMNTAIDYHELQSFIEEKGSKYQQYTIRARRVLQQKYKVLENIMAIKQTTPVFSLPGNYDMDLKYTSLHERDLHLHWHNVQGLKIAGYGGADIWTPGIPERYVVNYPRTRDPRPCAAVRPVRLPDPSQLLRQ
ncbi:MAG: hypothetical protein JRC60_01010 [Deltaproteobacteria bacterium]|nr:hypothetical protein [Deltaproteobacteria bacterium]